MFPCYLLHSWAQPVTERWYTPMAATATSVLPLQRLGRRTEGELQKHHSSNKANLDSELLPQMTSLSIKPDREYLEARMFSFNAAYIENDSTSPPSK